MHDEYRVSECAQREGTSTPSRDTEWTLLALAAGRSAFTLLAACSDRFRGKREQFTGDPPGSKPAGLSFRHRPDFHSRRSWGHPRFSGSYSDPKAVPFWAYHHRWMLGLRPLLVVVPSRPRSPRCGGDSCRTVPH